jgi:hypothetical protein
MTVAAQTMTRPHRPPSRSRATADRRAPGAPARRPAGPGRACVAATQRRVASHRSGWGRGHRRPATQPGSDSTRSSAARVARRARGGCTSCPRARSSAARRWVGVESRVHAHQRRRSPCRRPGSRLPPVRHPMPWQERGMEVDGAVPRQIQDRGRDEPPVVGEHDEVGVQPPNFSTTSGSRSMLPAPRAGMPSSPAGAHRWVARSCDDRPVSPVR